MEEMKVSKHQSLPKKLGQHQRAQLINVVKVGYFALDVSKGLI